MRISARLLLAISLAICLGCVKQDWIDRTLVTGDVSGVWTGSVVSLDGQPMVRYEVRFELQPKATKVTGYYEPTSMPLGVNARGVSTVEGKVANDVFTFEATRVLTGELTIDGDEMRGNGLAGSSRRVVITLRRVDAAAAGSPSR